MKICQYLTKLCVDYVGLLFLFHPVGYSACTIVTLQDMFSFALPSVRIARRTDKFIKELTPGHALS